MTSTHRKEKIYQEAVIACEPSPSLFNSEEGKVKPPDREAILASITYLRGLEDDWDGENLIAPHRTSLDMAEQFVWAFPLNRLHANRIRPNGDGGVTLIWDLWSTRVIITFDGAAIHYSITKNKEKPLFVNNMPYFGPDHKIPQELLREMPLRKQQKL